MVESNNNYQSNIDIVFKPRTNYSSTALRATQPNIDIKKKIQTITMSQLKVLTSLRLKGEGQDKIRKIKSVGHIPQVVSFSSKDKGKRGSFKNSSQVKLPAAIKEEQDEEDSEFQKDRQDFGDSSGESIDADGEEDEIRICQDIKKVQEQQEQQQNSDSSKNVIDSLIDQEMINLLHTCSKFKVPHISDLQEKFVWFGERTKNKVLVLDMDETLIHAIFLHNDNIKNDDGDFIVQIEGTKQNEEVKVSVKMRPYLDSCLEHLEKMYEIAVFTAGEQSYADAVLDYLDEERQIIKHRLYRQHCINTEAGIYVKDLRIIQDRPLKDIIIIDNSIVSFAFNLDNGVPIGAYMRQPGDEELLYMVSYLEEIYSFPDVTKHIANTFKLREMMQKHGNN